MQELAGKISDFLHDESLPTIATLQQSFKGGREFMIGISTLFDPRYVFLIYAPILFAINKSVGHRMIIALSLTEWINQILKWMLAGERPYWYVHEKNEAAALIMNETWSKDPFSFSNIQQAANYYPSLIQFPVTCELGAGSPSGHAMVSATVWYILIDAFLKNELPLFSRFQKQNRKCSILVGKLANSTLEVLTKLSWIAYSVMLILISLSRVYLACHFPHQCLCGAIFGLIIARFVAEYIKLEDINREHFVALTSIMFTIAMGTFAILKLNGFNPLWSVDKAIRWCVNVDYLHMDTTPFFSMVRYLGFCFGVGLAFDQEKLIARQPLTKSVINGPALVAQRLASACLSIYLGKVLSTITFAKDTPLLFYSSTFLIYTFFSYAIAKPIPKLAKTVVKSLVIGLDNKKKVF